MSHSYKCDCCGGLAEGGIHIESMHNAAPEGEDISSVANVSICPDCLTKPMKEVLDAAGIDLVDFAEGKT